jgi:hypothetical protein
MAALEYRILTKILESGTLAEANRMYLKEDHFSDHDARQIWKYILGYWFNPTTARTLPTLSRVRTRFPAFMPTANPADDVDLPALISELKMRRFEGDARAMSDYFRDLVEEDPQNAVRVMKSALSELSLRVEGVGDRCTGLHDIVRMAREQYDGAQSGIIYGIPWPWQCLTDDTLGKRGGDFTVFYGRMKSMKTWVMLYCAIFDFLVNNRRVLIWSREMSERKLTLRAASVLAKVDYQMFKSGLLPPRVEERTFHILESLLTRDPHEDMSYGASRGIRDLLLLCGRDAPKSLAELNQWVEKFQPDILYLDSFYHMDSDRSEGMSERWKRIAALAEDVKNYAEEHNLPIVAVHQANRLGEKTYGNTLADMADADVIAREADLIIRIVKKPGSVELHEEDYEVEFERLMRNRFRVAPRIPYGAPRIELPYDDPRLRMDKVIERIASRTDQNQARVGAELACVLGGNREGVLNAFTIRAIPGYNFELIDDRPSMKDIQKWVKEDDKASDEDEAKPKKVNVKPKVTVEDYSKAVHDAMKGGV